MLDWLSVHATTSAIICLQHSSLNMSYFCRMRQLQTQEKKRVGTPEDAQMRKFDRFVDNSKTRPTDYLLEIGTGWVVSQFVQCRKLVVAWHHLHWVASRNSWLIIALQRLVWQLPLRSCYTTIKHSQWLVEVRMTSLLVWICWRLLARIFSKPTSSRLTKCWDRREGLPCFNA